MPKEILAIAENVKLFVPEKGAEGWEVPKELKLEAFPPCMKALYSAASKGQNIFYAGRFALTSFLVNVGMPAESILELFRNSPDFKERVTLYQIEHIAGEKGSRTKYTPPRCDTLRTHGYASSRTSCVRKSGIRSHTTGRRPNGPREDFKSV